MPAATAAFGKVPRVGPAVGCTPGSAAASAAELRSATVADDSGAGVTGGMVGAGSGSGAGGAGLAAGSPSKKRQADSATARQRPDNSAVRLGRGLTGAQSSAARA